MRYVFVTFIALALLGSIYFLRQNPETAEQIQASVQNTIDDKNLESRTDLLLPDMKIVPPKELYIFGSGKNKVIRFSTTFSNIGQGVLELIGHHEPGQSKTFATQYIKKTDGTGEYREIGTFVYHPEHKHWHVDNYVLYQLWTIKDENKPDQLVATTNKQSFCIWDEHTSDLTIPNASKFRFYTSACSRSTQGMSIGWADTYLARVEGQEIGIENVPDGQYILTFEVNPDRRILETEYQNNLDWLKVEIKGSRLTVIPD